MLAYFVASTIAITAEYIARAVSTATEIWLSFAARRFENGYGSHCNNECEEKINIHDAWLDRSKKTYQYSKNTSTQRDGICDCCQERTVCMLTWAVSKLDNEGRNIHLLYAW